MGIEERIFELEKKLVDLEQRFDSEEARNKKEQETTWLTTAQAAKRLGMNRQALLRQIRNGQVRYRDTLPGSKWSRKQVSEAEILRQLALRSK